MDLIVRHDVRTWRSPPGIEPTGMEPRVPAAPNVRGQAVPHHPGLCGIKVRDRGKAAPEVFSRWFVGADPFRNKDPLKEERKAGALDPLILHGGAAVGGDIEMGFPLQLTQQFFRAGNELMSLRQQQLLAFPDPGCR